MLKKFIHIVSLILILLVFLVSTNGMNIYHCLCPEKKEAFYTLAVNTDCCTGSGQNTEKSKESCCRSTMPLHAHKTICSQIGCAKKTSFYKIASVSKIENDKISFKKFSNIVFSHSIPSPEKESEGGVLVYFKEKPPLITDIIIAQHVLTI